MSGRTIGIKRLMLRLIALKHKRLVCISGVLMGWLSPPHVPQLPPPSTQVRANRLSLEEECGNFQGKVTFRRSTPSLTRVSGDN